MARKITTEELWFKDSTGITGLAKNVKTVEVTSVLPMKSSAIHVMR